MKINPNHHPLVIIIKIYDNWKVTRDKDIEITKEKELRANLVAQINTFWKDFIGKNRSKLEERIRSWTSKEINKAVDIKQLIVRVEKILVENKHKSVNYIIKDLKNIYKLYEEAELSYHDVREKENSYFFKYSNQKESLDDMLLEYILNVARLAVKIPDSNVFFSKFIGKYYNRIVNRVQQKYPNKNEFDLLHNAYEVLTTRNKDKLPPSDHAEVVINYILGACKFVLLSDKKKKKEKMNFTKNYAYQTPMRMMPLIPLI